MTTGVSILISYLIIVLPGAVFEKVQLETVGTKHVPFKR